VCRTTPLVVSEVYASLQGESTQAGRPCTFVRLTGCPLRCVWCDTAWAFHGGERTTLGHVLDRVRALGLPLVEVTGGEPLSQAGCVPLCDALLAAGYEVMLETSGAFDLAPVDPRVRRIVDLKCPDSGEVDKNRWENLALLGPGDELKAVVASRADFDWALDVLRERLAALPCSVLWSPVWSAVAPADLAAWILEARAPGRLQLQLHKVLWPGADRGV